MLPSLSAEPIQLAMRIAVSTPEPPADHYVWLGRVISACSMLELQIGMIGWAATTGEAWTENWAQVAGLPGGAICLCSDAIPLLDPELASDVQRVLDEATPVRRERNKFSHAVFTLDPTRPPEDQWVLRSARDVEFRPITAAEGGDLIRVANRLSKQAASLRIRAAKDHASRTDRGV